MTRRAPKLIYRNFGARMQSKHFLGVSTAQRPLVDRQVLLQTTRFAAEGAYSCCFGADQSFFAAPHTQRNGHCRRAQPLRRSERR
jgi:hypothetical protein